MLRLERERTITTLTCAKLATARPKVNAMCTTVGVSVHVMQEAQPMKTNRNVPRISANSITRKSSLVISSKPTNSLIPAKENRRIKSNCNPFYFSSNLSIWKNVSNFYNFNFHNSNLIFLIKKYSYGFSFRMILVFLVFKITEEKKTSNFCNSLVKIFNLNFIYLSNIIF